MAIDNLKDAVNQAVSDFDGIKDEIEANGVIVGNIPTEEYPDKINEIPVFIAPRAVINGVAKETMHADNLVQVDPNKYDTIVHTKEPYYAFVNTQGDPVYNKYLSTNECSGTSANTKDKIFFKYIEHSAWGFYIFDKKNKQIKGEVSTYNLLPAPFNNSRNTYYIHLFNIADNEPAVMIFPGFTPYLYQFKIYKYNESTELFDIEITPEVNVDVATLISDYRENDKEGIVTFGCCVDFIDKNIVHVHVQNSHGVLVGRYNIAENKLDFIDNFLVALNIGTTLNQYSIHSLYMVSTENYILFTTQDKCYKIKKKENINEYTVEDFIVVDNIKTNNNQSYLCDYYICYCNNSLTKTRYIKDDVIYALQQPDTRSSNYSGSYLSMTWSKYINKIDLKSDAKPAHTGTSYTFDSDTIMLNNLPGDCNYASPGISSNYIESIDENGVATITAFYNISWIRLYRPEGQTYDTWIYEMYSYFKRRFTLDLVNGTIKTLTNREILVDKAHAPAEFIAKNINTLFPGCILILDEEGQFHNVGYNYNPDKTYPYQYWWSTTSIHNVSLVKNLKEAEHIGTVNENALEGDAVTVRVWTDINYQEKIYEDEEG